MWSRARVLGALAVFGLVFPASAASAQSSAAGGKSGAIKPSTAKRLPVGHKVGEYGGVTPGVVYRYHFELKKKGNKRVERTVKRRTNRRAKRRLSISWVGFQLRSGGSRLFFQLNREAQYTQAMEKNVLVVTIEGARYGSRNSRRKIEMRYFDTALLRVATRRIRSRRARKDKPARKGGIAFFIHFKNSADAKQAAAELKKSDTDGYYYLNLDFGPATPIRAGSGTVDKPK